MLLNPCKRGLPLAFPLAFYDWAIGGRQIIPPYLATHIMCSVYEDINAIFKVNVGKRDEVPTRTHRVCLYQMYIMDL